MAKKGAVDSDAKILSEFKDGMASWGSAVQAHKQAPPDHDFAARLTSLAQGATDAARVCRSADAAGFAWPPARKADSEPPYELRPDTGRRGPEKLWQQFDQAITRLSTVAAGEDMLEVARAYEELASTVAELADVVRAEDEPGRTASPPRRRRSA
jgi:hypothetical protein